MAEAETLIAHVDVDAFFASVEQLLVPALRSRPVVVGSGVIASCSYEARRFGLKAGMPLHQARRLCPQAVFLRGDYQVYRCFAEHVWDVCRRFTCGLETYLDEAFGDATGMERIHGDPLSLGRKLQRQVRREVGLPVSVGLAANRILAKIASAYAKPGGVAWIRPGEEQDFLRELPVSRLLGVGHKTEARLADMNIRTVGQLMALPRQLLASMFGLRGLALYERCRGRDDQSVRSGGMPKTISRETTFHEPTCRPEQIRGMLFYLLERAMRLVRQRRLLARRVELSIRYDDWRAASAQRSLAQPSDCEQAVLATVLEMLGQLHTRRVALRHVGIVLSGFVPRSADARLFQPRQDQRRRELHQAIDEIRSRYGHAAVVVGKSIDLLGRLEQNDYGFVLRTPSLTK